MKMDQFDNLPPKNIGISIDWFVANFIQQHFFTNAEKLTKINKTWKFFALELKSVSWNEKNFFLHLLHVFENYHNVKHLVPENAVVIRSFLRKPGTFFYSFCNTFTFSEYLSFTTGLGFQTHFYKLPRNARSLILKFLKRMRPLGR